MKSALTFLFFLLLSFVSLAELPSKVSDNNNFLVRPAFNFLKHTMTFDVFSVAKKGLIRQIHQHCFWKKGITDYKVSNDAHFLAVYTKDSLIVWNVRKQRVDQSFLGSHLKIFFLHHGEDYLVLYDGGYLAQYKAGMDKPVFHYNLKDDDVNEIEVDDADQFIFVKGKMNKVFVYRLMTAKPAGYFTGKEYALNTDNSELVALFPLGGKYCFMKYSFPKLKRQLKVVPDKDLIRYIREKKLSPQSKPNLEYQDARLSKDAKFIAFKVVVDKKETVVFVYDVNKRKVLTHTSLGNEIAPDLFLVWNENNELVVQSEAMKIQRYSPATDSLGFKEIDMTFQSYKDKQTISDEKQVVERIIGQDGNAEVLPSKSWFSKKVFIKSMRTNDEFLTLKKASFLTLSKDGKYLFVEQGNETAFMRINDSLGSNSLTFFNVDIENLEQPDLDDDEDSLDRIELLKADSLDLIDDFNTIRNYIHIKDISDSAELKLLYKNVLVNDSLVTVQFQLIDKQGNYYYGASQDAYKEIWCNMLLNNNGGTYQQIKTFKVSESLVHDTVPNSVSLVGDFSGSMGQSRVDKLTVGMHNFIDNKFSEDEVSIVKYDHKTRVEAKRELRIKDLKDAVNKHNYSYFGSTTAMLDGIDEAIQVMKSSKVKGIKVVIVLTDGYENSSMATMNEVIDLAKKNGTQVYTIALGDFVNEPLLKTVALHTNGGYYKIKSSSSLKWIYEDIYRKVRSFYEVEFKTDTLGMHKLILKACQPNCKSCADDMEVVFDNSFHPQPKKFDVNDPNYFTLFATKDSIRSTDSVLTKFPDISDYSGISTKVKSPLKTEVPSDTSHVDFDVVDNEFMKLQLPKFNFILDNDSIVGDYTLKLDSLVNFLKKHEGVNMRIIGHTDDQGSEQYNDKLSLLRAKKVKALLVRRGINPARIICEGRGETEPLESNDTEDGRVLNRRIEFEIFEK